MFARLQSSEIYQQLPALRRYAHVLSRDVDDAEDLVQDVLERAVSREDQFHRGTNLRRWLFTILHNRAVDVARRHRRQGTRVPLDEWERDAIVLPEQEDALALRDVGLSLDRLPPSDRRVLRNVAIDGMSQEAAAREEGVAVGTIKSRLSRARARLKDMQLAGNRLH